jgi:uncharacterized membrane protein (DUF373 family)
MDVGGRFEVEVGRRSRALFVRIEHAVYLALGLVLIATAVLALGSAVVLLWGAVTDWSGTEAIITVVDRLLFVLMLIEILHTVRDSLRSGALACEPFLIVGLIASIRRVLVITLESSQARQKGWSVTTEHLFRASMIELAVLAGLILVMVVSIWLLRRSRGARSEPDVA